MFFFENCKIFKKSFFHKSSSVAASGHLHIFSKFALFNFFHFPFRSSYRNCSIKMFAISAGKHLCWILFLITFSIEGLQHLLKRPATSTQQDSNTGVFLWIFLFTNSYSIICVSPSVFDIFSKNDHKRKNVKPIIALAVFIFLKQKVWSKTTHF